MSVNIHLVFKYIKQGSELSHKESNVIGQSSFISSILYFYVFGTGYFKTSTSTISVNEFRSADNSTVSKTPVV